MDVSVVSNSPLFSQSELSPNVVLLRDDQQPVGNSGRYTLRAPPARPQALRVLN